MVSIIARSTNAVLLPGKGSAIFQYGAGNSKIGLFYNSIMAHCILV